MCSLDMSSTQLLRIKGPYLLISIESPSYRTPTESNVSWCDGDIELAVESLVTMRQSRPNGMQARTLCDPLTAGCIHTIESIEDMP